MEEQKGFELDLKHILKLILKKAWLIVLVSVLCAAIMIAYTSFFVADTYTVVTQMTVSNVVDAPNVEQVGMTSSDVIAATSLIDTYCVILKNENSLNRILTETGLQDRYSIASLRSMIAVGGVNESLVLQIQVTSPNPQDAQAIANAATKVLQETELRGASATPLYQVSAPDIDRPDSKGTSTKAIVGFLLGAIVTAMILIVIDLKRDNIHSDEWLKETFGESVPVLAVIPDVNRNNLRGKGRRYGYYARYGYYRADRSKAAD
ncbi:MAG: hypothetical protein IJW16_03915 [Clostridia bacterium]|nr:hypothetical protein [Clostridia bacterium]